MRFAACLLMALSAAALAADDAYVADIGKWRQDFEADIRTGGWLTIVNRVELSQREARVGSEAKSTVVLPARAPKQFGSITRDGAVFWFTPAAGVECSLDGTPVKAPVNMPTERGKGRIEAGALSFVIRAVGDAFFVLVTDRDSPELQRFSGVSWFPANPAWRVPAQFIAYDKPESARVPMTHIEAKKTMSSTGDVVFDLDGKRVRLKTFIDEQNLFVMFSDATNGHETYGGGRFIEAPLPKDGFTTLDFNKAFNPYCSLNSNIMCPLVPAANRIETRVAAGEKYEGGS
jgi:uncharacterized protein